MAHATTGLVAVSNEKQAPSSEKAFLGSAYTVPLSEQPEEEFREHQYRQIQDRYTILRKLGETERWLDRKVGAVCWVDFARIFSVDFLFHRHV